MGRKPTKSKTSLGKVRKKFLQSLFPVVYCYQERTGGSMYPPPSIKKPIKSSKSVTCSGGGVAGYSDDAPEKIVAMAVISL